MAAIESNRRGAGALFGRWHGNFFARTLDAVFAWNDARVTRAALSRLSDRELDDIGLTRGEIDRIR